MPGSSESSRVVRRRVLGRGRSSSGATGRTRFSGAWLSEGRLDFHGAVHSIEASAIEMARLRRAPRARVAALLLAVLAVSGCATTSADRLRLVIQSSPPATQLAGLSFDRARDYVVSTRDGRITRGRVTMSDGALVVEEAPQRSLVVPDADILLVGVVAGASRMRRGWIGAAVGALVSVPFGLSIKGDMVVPAAILGAQLARRTGDEYVRVLLDRRPGPVSPAAAPPERKAGEGGPAARPPR